MQLIANATGHIYRSHGRFQHSICLFVINNFRYGKFGPNSLLGAMCFVCEECVIFDYVKIDVSPARHLHISTSSRLRDYAELG